MDDRAGFVTRLEGLRAPPERSVTTFSRITVQIATAPVSRNIVAAGRRKGLCYSDVNHG
jgi:hypothetical protein